MAHKHDDDRLRRKDALGVYVCTCAMTDREVRDALDANHARGVLRLNELEQEMQDEYREDAHWDEPE